MSDARKYLEEIESTGIAARTRRAERMDLDDICRIYAKPAKEMTNEESANLDFFFRYHPDAFKAIDKHLGRL